MPKIILRSREARDKILSGLNLVADIIAATAGPQGRNVILQQKNLLVPLIINDGVTIAKDISLIDPFENIGAAMVQEVANTTNQDAGDGTTTATILLQALVNLAFENIEDYRDPITLKKEIAEAAQIAVGYLKELIKKIKHNEEIISVATIASANPTLARLIGKAYEIVGNDGIIKIETAQTFESSLEVNKGFEFNGGYLSRYMLTDLNQPEINWYDVKILVYNEKFHNLKAIFKILEECSRTKTKLVLIAQSFSDEIIAVLAMNKMKNILDVIAIKPVNYFSDTQLILDDLAVIIGQKPVYLETELTQLSLDDLVIVNQIKITKDQTTIIHQLADESGYHTYLQKLVNQQQQLSPKTREYDDLQNRIAALQAKIAMIKIGGQTEVEQQEKKYRIEDALNATQHAIKNGVVPGAGMSLFYVAYQLSQAYPKPNGGTEILIRALKTPALQILANAGVGSQTKRLWREDRYDDQELIQKLTSLEPWIYLNHETNKITDAWSAGIFDPYTVVLTALTKAVSVATTLMTTEAVVVEAVEKQRFVFPDIR
ncbi:chaperonin GroEL [Mycoplasmoides fastidiosum]|uniref:Chaperonin GroEL n=1 Tax=Mycoplasmoides fastidiosum TaxID=92758 RepID=A0ABU0LY60_9BACT|nr:chaperonin GroEL [Mycoplasmoides fastidiosum]MDQ0513652.1 chaperonin GroEL [Mycoplasmoides fastidiosum]UUD37928.1 chaperonin GroEL [Mycoplasmoides fastidiosum]